MRINHNLMAINTHRQMGVVSGAQSKSMEKLSSGYRINRAGDDAAGLAISEKMRAQIRGLNQASRNAQDGISLVQTAEGALNETHSILQRMRELAVQSANDTNVTGDRVALQNEINELAKEVGRIAETTEFNTQKVLDGTFDGTFHIGANQGQSIELTIGSMKSLDLGVTGEATTTFTDDVTVTNTDSTFAAGTYSVSVDTEGTYKLSDSTGKVVAESADGLTFDSLTSTNDTFTLDQEVLVGGDVVFSAGTTIDTYEGIASTVALEAGTYTVDMTNDLLLDSQGNTVATTADQTTWTDASGATVLQFATAHAGGDLTVEVQGTKITTQDDAQSAITTINSALEKVSDQRAQLGAVQNRLEHSISNLDTTSENLQASESRIRDVDMAKEMMEFTKNNILSQAAQSMLAQANQAPQGVLQLLR